MKKLLMIVSVAFVLASCGGGGKSVSKDAKVDFQLDFAKMKQLDTSMDDAVRKPYEGKMVEMKGYITKSQKSVDAASPNKYSLHLSPTATEEGTDYVICYTDDDPSGSIGKQVTVKGTFEYPGAAGLKNAIFY